VTSRDLEERLEVGLDVFLDLQPGVPNAPRYGGRIRGWETNRYILIGLNPGGAVPLIRKGKECVVRFMHDGEVWGFGAQLGETAMHTELPLLHLHWPREVARLQVRKHERVAIEIPCTLHLGDDQTDTGTIGDLSGGGCCIVTMRNLAVGDSVHLSFRMPEGFQVNRRPVRIRNRKSEPGGKLRYGCQFQEEKEEDHGIQLFVARKKALDRGESAPHPQLLVLSRNDEDIRVVQQALAGTPYEVVAAEGILDLGYRLRTCKTAGILVSYEQKELSAIEVIPLIQQSPGMAAVPIFVYGGGSVLHGQAAGLGAALCLDHLASARDILPFLPAVEAPAPAAPRVADSAVLDDGERPAAGIYPDADLEVGGDGLVDDDDSDDDEGDEIDLG